MDSSKQSHSEQTSNIIFSFKLEIYSTYINISVFSFKKSI